MAQKFRQYLREPRPRKKLRISAARLRELPTVAYSLEELAQVLGLDYGTVHRWTTLPRPMPTNIVVVERNKHYSIRRNDLIVWLYQTRRLTPSAETIALELVQAIGARTLPAPEPETPTGRPSRIARLKALPYSPR